MRDFLLKYPNFAWKNTLPADAFFEGMKRDFFEAFQDQAFAGQIQKAKSGDLFLMFDNVGGSIESKAVIKNTSIPQATEPGGLMEFTGIMTHFDGSSEDLDGDIVEPLGGTIAKNAPLLMFHSWDLPIGRNVGVTEQTSSVVRVKNIIADTQLGADAAALIEVGGLRMSHGFESVECHAIEKTNERGHLICTGVRFKKWITRELTLTPMPANEMAIVEAWSRKSIKSPSLGLIAQGLDRIRTKSVSTAQSTDAKQNMDAIFHGFGERFIKAVEGRLKVLGILKEDSPEPEGKKPEDDKTGSADSGKSDDKKKPEEEKKPEEKKTNATMAEMIASLQAIADGEIPETAKSRLGTVISLATEVQGMMTENADKISEAASADDVAGMFEGVADVIADIVSKLSDACEEIEKILGIDGIGDPAGSSLKGAHEGCKAIMEAIGGILEAAEEVEGNHEESTEPKETEGGSDSDRDFSAMTASAMALAGHLIAGKSISSEAKELLLMSINS